MGLWVKENELGNDTERQRRMRENPPVSSQLEALWGYLEHRREAGETLPTKVDTMLNRLNATKTKHPPSRR